MKKLLWTAVGVVSLVIICGGFLYYKYEQSLKFHQTGINDLSNQKWNDAKVSFEQAKQSGIGMFFRHDIENTYQPAVNVYSNKVMKQVKTEFQSANFSKMETDIKQVPKDATSVIQESAKKYTQMDPLKVVVSNYLPPSEQIISKQTLLLTKDIPAVVIAGKHNSNGNVVFDFEIINYDSGTGAYKMGYQDQSPASNPYQASNGEMKVQTGKIFSDDRIGIVETLSDPGGSVSFTTINVYGWDLKTKQFTKYMNLPNLADTVVNITDGKVIVNQSNDQTTEYSWNGDQFEGKDVYLQPTVQQGDISVHYSIGSNESIYMDQNNITLHIGQKLYLIKDNHANNDERFMQMNGNEEVVDYIPSNGTGIVMQGKKQGTAEMEIVPNYGDWDKAKKFNINVIP